MATVIAFLVRKRIFIIFIFSYLFWEIAFQMRENFVKPFARLAAIPFFGLASRRAKINRAAS